MIDIMCRRNNGQRRASKQEGQKGQVPGRGDAEDASTAQMADQSTADVTGQTTASSYDTAEFESKAGGRAAAKLAEPSASMPAGPKKKPWSEGTIQARAEEAVKRGTLGQTLEWLEAESDEGNVEYKLRLKDPSTMRFQQLVRINHK